MPRYMLAKAANGRRRSKSESVRRDVTEKHARRPLARARLALPTPHRNEACFVPFRAGGQQANSTAVPMPSGPRENWRKTLKRLPARHMSGLSEQDKNRACRRRSPDPGLIVSFSRGREQAMNTLVTLQRVRSHLKTCPVRREPLRHGLCRPGRRFAIPPLFPFPEGAVAATQPCTNRPSFLGRTSSGSASVSLQRG